MSTPSHIIEEVLKVYADPESWEVISRSSSDWNEYQYHGDDGHEHAWEAAQQALTALEDMRALHTAEQRAAADRLKQALGE